jgi:hypothetical protein
MLSAEKPMARVRHLCFQVRCGHGDGDGDGDDIDDDDTYTLSN